MSNKQICLSVGRVVQKCQLKKKICRWQDKWPGKQVWPHKNLLAVVRTVTGLAIMMAVEIVTITATGRKAATVDKVGTTLDRMD